MAMLVRAALARPRGAALAAAVGVGGGRRLFRASAAAALPEIPFKLADIGEGIAEVEVLQWFVKDGDPIKQFQNVCEVQSDKATVEITSRYDGVVTKLYYNVGEMAKVGSTLIDIEVDDATAAAAHVPHQKPSGGPTRKAPTPVGVTTKQAPPASEKAPAPVVAVAPSLARADPLPEPVRRVDVLDDEKIRTSPSVRRLAREHNIDLRAVTPTGPQNRLLKEDLLEYIRVLASTPPAPKLVPEAGSSSPEERAAGAYLVQDTTISLTPVQKMMAKSMNAALQIPHFGYADEIEMDQLFQLRQQLKPLAEAKGIKLSFMPFIIKAASLALKDYPVLNATVSEDETAITMVAAHNISVAMDTPVGLIVPNVKDVQTKSILDIAEDLNRLQDLATAGKLSPNDLKGGTFSISNIGSIGGTYMGPVIMVPQVAIGAIGKIQTLPRFDSDGSVKPVKIMNVSWSGDHRVIDGATMARFSNQWKTFLETPVAMLTELR